MGDVKHVNMQHIRLPLSVLTAANEIYYSGQFIVAIDDVTKNEGIKVGDWDADNDPQQLHATRFNDRPWLSPPSNFGASKVNVFSADTANTAGNAHYAYDVPSDTITVTDERFLGKANFPVFCTQTGGGALRKDLLTFDAIAGTVKISGLQLQVGEQLFFSLPTGIATDPDYLTLNAKIDALQNTVNTLLFPLLPIGVGPGKIASPGKIWYTGDVALLAGTGWQVCALMQGKYPLAKDAGDADFNKAQGTPVGSKTFKISSVGMLPEHAHFIAVDEAVNSGGHPSDFGRGISALRSLIRYFFKADGGGAESYELCGANGDNIQPNVAPTSKTGKAVPDDIKFIPQSIIGVWIEYVGL